MTDTKRMHVIVEGRVQGVFFRASTRDEAVRLGLAGWVKNRRDGAVEAIIEGESQAVGKMLEWFHKGPPNAEVDKVQSIEEPSVNGEEGFEIRY